VWQIDLPNRQPTKKLHSRFMIEQETQPESSEAAQIGSILQGNAEAFNQLVKPYQRGLYRKALSIIQSEADAEEAVQNAVFKAFNKLSQFRHDSQFGTWLMSITINEARMSLRRNCKHRHESLEWEDAEGHQRALDIADQREDPFQELERKQVRAAIHEALNLLPGVNSQVFILRDLQLLSIAETARALGISETCVKTRLRRGRGQMRRALAHLRARGAPKQINGSTGSAMGRIDSAPRFVRGGQFSESLMESVQ
jgi:RNA polymerase sigma-70 factor (ECF subfamily)